MKDLLTYGQVLVEFAEWCNTENGIIVSESWYIVWTITKVEITVASPMGVEVGLFVDSAEGMDFAPMDNRPLTPPNRPCSSAGRADDAWIESPTSA